MTFEQTVIKFKKNPKSCRTGVFFKTPDRSKIEMLYKDEAIVYGVVVDSPKKAQIGFTNIFIHRELKPFVEVKEEVMLNNRAVKLVSVYQFRDAKLKALYITSLIKAKYHKQIAVNDVERGVVKITANDKTTLVQLRKAFYKIGFYTESHTKQSYFLLMQ